MNAATAGRVRVNMLPGSSLAGFLGSVPLCCIKHCIVLYKNGTGVGSGGQHTTGHVAVTGVHPYSLLPKPEPL